VRGDARSKPGASPTAAAVAKGHAAYMARDYPAATQAYKEAIAQDGSDAASYYFLGEAQIAGGSTVEADASFAAGLRNVGGKDDLRGKLLFVVADLRERQGKWPEAKKAWEEYAQFLATHPSVKGYAATATERVKVVDARADLDTKYAPVRQRIEDRIKENAATPPPADETPRPQAPAKKK
jgi:tetratricopeptide (TPR) repeat protein